MPDNIGMIPILSAELIKESLRQGRINANSARKQEASQRLDLYDGKQLDLLDEDIRAQFQHPERLRLQKEFSNITKEIIDTVSLVYKKAPKRTLRINGVEVDEKAADNFHAMYDGSKIDSVMKRTNRFANLLNTVGIKAFWNDGKVELQLLTPNFLDVIQSVTDPGEAAGVIIEISFGDTVNFDDSSSLGKRLFILFTDTEHRLFDQDGDELPITGNENGVNPYNLIPITWVRDRNPNGMFWAHGTEDLIAANRSLNVKLTELNHLVKMQAFSIPVIVTDGVVKTTSVDPSSFIVIPLGDATRQGNPDFKFVSPDPKIADVLDVIDRQVVRIARAWNISPDAFKLTGSVTSGFALKMQNLRLLERRQDDVETYLEAERDLFNRMRRVWNTHQPENKKISEEAELHIDYAEPEFPEDPNAEDVRWEGYLRNGLKSRVDWLMSINPDVTSKEEAERILKENGEINQRTKPSSGLGITGFEDLQDTDAEGDDTEDDEGAGDADE